MFNRLGSPPQCPAAAVSSKTWERTPGCPGKLRVIVVLVFMFCFFTQKNAGDVSFVSFFNHYLGVALHGERAVRCSPLGGFIRTTVGSVRVEQRASPNQRPARGVPPLIGYQRCVLGNVGVGLLTPPTCFLGRAPTTAIVIPKPMPRDYFKGLFQRTLVI